VRPLALLLALLTAQRGAADPGPRGQRPLRGLASVSRPFYGGCVALALGLVLVLGCGPWPIKRLNAGDPSGLGAPAPASRVYQLTPAGTGYHLPQWEGWTPELLALIPADIDSTSAQGGTRTLQDPAAYGWTVYIGNPGSLEHPSGQLAAGWVDYPTKTIYVAWQDATAKAIDLSDGTRNGPLLPALSHEIGHIFGGPSANHDGLKCPGCFPYDAP
jgi:hypothetical protein